MWWPSWAARGVPVGDASCSCLSWVQRRNQLGPVLSARDGSVSVRQEAPTPAGEGRREASRRGGYQAGWVGKQDGCDP